MSFAYRPAHPIPVGSPEPVVSESPSARTYRLPAPAAVVACEDEDLDESLPHPPEARAPSARMAAIAAAIAARMTVDDVMTGEPMRTQVPELSRGQRRFRLSSARLDLELAPHPGVDPAEVAVLP